MRNLLGFLARICFVSLVTLGLLKAGDYVMSPPERIEVQKPYTEADVEALAKNIYHESRGLRGKGDVGWRAVAAVVFNRLDSPRFPKTVPEVVYEKRGECAFSWVCTNLVSAPIRNKKLFAEIREEAERYLTLYHAGTWKDPVKGAHSYHANTVKPNRYFQKLTVVVVLRDGTQAHYFYV